jgi:RHS repeat-associated protein
VTVLDENGTPRTVNESLYGNPWTFTGRRLDQETGLMYYRNRMYSVELGRFVSRDPWQLKLDTVSAGDGYADCMSLYAYTCGRVCRSTDPTGMATLEVIYDLWGTEKTNWMGFMVTYNTTQSGYSIAVFDLEVNNEAVSVTGNVRDASRNTQAEVVVDRWVMSSLGLAIAFNHNTASISHAATGTHNKVCCEKDKAGNPSKWGVEIVATFISTAGKISKKESIGIPNPDYSPKKSGVVRERPKM